MQSISLGNAVESIVAEFLCANGLTYLQRNYRCRVGEIDLVFHDPAHNTIVFIEVRYRANASYGHAIETVDRLKQKKLKRAALQFMQGFFDARQSARIDVIGVSKKAPDTVIHTDTCTTLHVYQGFHLCWIRNAVTD